IESDDILFAQLKKSVADFYGKNKQIRQPICMHGTFADCVGEVMKQVQGALAPAFLFVDPCGVIGASFSTIREVMTCAKCESFVFFNIDGVRRIAGLDQLSDVLVDLMGSHDRAKSLYEELRKSESVTEREQLILRHYRAALNEIGAEYTVAFRVEHE